MSRTPASLDVPALTALRAIAALLVFLYHFAPAGLPGLAGVVAGQGHVGVTVFFVLSGFLITVRYYPRFAEGGQELGAYFVKRVARILPLYYVVLALTHLLSNGSVPVDWSHLPEWTLTHALLGAAPPDAITVSTSWSLTVEECFYASAPLLFLGLAASRRRRGAAGSAAVLVAVTAGLYLAGSVIVRLLGAGGARALPFLSQEPLLRYYTVFGRFPDFALGVGAGLLFLSGSVERAWNRRSGAAWATVAAVAGVALLVAGEAGMARNGGSFAEWRWDLLVALASAVIVVALTCRHAPLSRLLSLRPAVYLGRVSYALYLIQLTPLGNGVLSRLLPGSDLLSLAGRYAGMNVIAAVLFELVEEPARETILAFRRRGSLAALPPARNRLAQGLSVAILFGGLAAQHVVWALASLRPVEETRVMQVLGAESEAVVRANVSPPAETRPPRLRLPPSWQEGPVGDRWAPRSLLVFVDGHPVPFLGARPPDSGEIAAYYHGRRAGQLSLRLAQPAQVTVVNHKPLVALALAWSRLGDAPLLSIAPLLLLGAAAAAVCWSRRSRPWSPRVCLACATCLVLAWLLCGLHQKEWAPLVLLIELTALTWLVLVRGPSPRLEGHLARD